MKLSILLLASKLESLEVKHLAQGMGLSLLVILSVIGGWNSSAFAANTQKMTSTPIPMTGKGAEVPENLKDVGIVDKLGQTIDLSTQFFNEKGEKVPLSTYFHSKKPVLFVLSYYNCPHLCTLVLNGTLDAMKGMDWTIAKEFNIVTLSIDHREGSDLSSEKKSSYIKGYGRLGAENGWHFLTGEEAAIKKISDQLGFRFHYVPEKKDFAHGAGIFVLTPEGKISRILYGIAFSSRDLKFALNEAAGGKVGTIVDRLLFYCYQYDPHSRGYSLYAMRLVQAGGIVTLLLIGFYFLMFWRTQRRVNRT